MPAEDDDDENERLRAAEADAEAFRREVAQVIRAQKQQIAVLERQAYQLANEAAAEQRYNSSLAANASSTKLARLQAEHSRLSGTLDNEGRRAMELTIQLEQAESDFAQVRDDASRLIQNRRAMKARATGPLLKAVIRTLSAADDATAGATKLREEVDHLRKERLVFLEKLRDLELQIREQQALNAECESSIRNASSRRDSALSHARRVEDAAERRARLRTVQRQQMAGQLHAVELQARQARSRLRERMASATNAAMGGGAAALHKARVKEHHWPPTADKEGLLAQKPMPRSLHEVVFTLSELMACDEDLELICERLAAEDREHEERMRELEAVRKELGQAEERNEKLKREVESTEATGGGDSAEHHALREQLTEMQAQGIAIQAAEERHARILAHCASAVLAMRAELSGEPTTKQESLHLQALSGRDALMQTLESAVEMAESRLGGGG